MPPARITIRLSPVLAARLAATVGPHGNLADLVRHAIEAYLDNEPLSRQPAAASTAAVADDVTTLADVLAAMQHRLEMVEQRLIALEAVAATGGRRQPPRQPATARAPTPQATAAEGDHAYARMQALQAQGMTLAQIAAQLDVEGLRTKRGKPWHKSTVAYVLKTHGR